MRVLRELRGLLSCLKHRRRPAPRADRSDDAILQSSAYFAYRYGLSQAAYFAKCGEWDNRTLAPRLGVNQLDIPGYLFPWHAPAIQLMETLPRDGKVLDVCGGLGAFLLFLHFKGFTNLAGTDDSQFQPGIVHAARAFLAHYGAEIPVHDFFAGYTANYAGIPDAGRYDVVTLFGLSTLSLFEPAVLLLKPGGFFIYESMVRGVPMGFDRLFIEHSVHEHYGRGSSRIPGTCGAVTILQKR